MGIVGRKGIEWDGVEIVNTIRLPDIIAEKSGVRRKDGEN